MNVVNRSSLEDISNTQRTASAVARGRHMDRNALDELLADAELAARGS